MGRSCRGLPPTAEARRVLTAKGHLVTSGLVDIHAHVLVNGHDMGCRTDHFRQASGVAALCDAGSTGSANFTGSRHLLDHEVRTRVRACVKRIVRPDGSPIPRLYSAGEPGSIYSYLYQGTGNIGERLTFGRVSGRNAAAETPWD